jgi:hypothetical protein
MRHIMQCMHRPRCSSAHRTYLLGHSVALCVVVAECPQPTSMSCSRSWCTCSVENRCLPRPRARVPGPSAHAPCKSAPACSAWSLSGPKRVVLAAYRRCRHSSGAWMSLTRTWSWDVLTHTASSCAPDVGHTLGPLLFQARGQ